MKTRAINTYLFDATVAERKGVQESGVFNAVEQSARVTNPSGVEAHGGVRKLSPVTIVVVLRGKKSPQNKKTTEKHTHKTDKKHDCRKSSLSSRETNRAGM